jgi:hypothetical protein
VETQDVQEGKAPPDPLARPVYLAQVDTATVHREKVATFYVCSTARPDRRATEGFQERLVDQEALLDDLADRRRYMKPMIN